MVLQLPPDLEQQLKELLATGEYSSEEQVVRAALSTLKDRWRDLTAIREAIADMEAGDRGKPFDEFVQEFRAKNGIPQDL